MKQLGLFTFASAVLLSAVSVQGQCNYCPTPTAGQRCASTYHTNVAWPSYYIPTSRSTINNTMAIMVANGWRRQTLLGDYHFDPETNELTSAGKLKSHWILTQTPMDRRAIYVERGTTETDTAARIAAVQNWAAGLSPTVEPVSVTDTSIVSEGRSAAAVDSIFVGFQANQPPPILPTESNGDSSGGSN
jgi:hypothetical protein